MGGTAPPQSPSGVEFTDDHIHLDPVKGEGIGAAKKFVRAGGKNLFLVNKMARDWGLEPGRAEAFREVYSRTITMGREVREKAGARVFVVLGVHPAEFAHMCKELGIERALEVGKEAITMAGKEVEEGSAVALGEVGLPHFEVDEAITDACRVLLSHAMATAADLGCAVQLHTGMITGEGLCDLRRLALEAGLEPGRVVKHHAQPLVKAAEEAGIYLSIVAKKEDIKAAQQEGGRFLMESDYIDDLRRPGAVVGPKSVPRLSLQLLREGILGEEDLWRIHNKNIEEAYGVEL